MASIDNNNKWRNLIFCFFFFQTLCLNFCGCKLPVCLLAAVTVTKTEWQRGKLINRQPWLLKRAIIQIIRQNFLFFFLLLKSFLLFSSRFCNFKWHKELLDSIKHLKYIDERMDKRTNAWVRRSLKYSIEIIFKCFRTSFPINFFSLPPPFHF